MSKKFSKMKSWEQTALLKVPVKSEEEQDDEEDTYAELLSTMSTTMRSGKVYLKVTAATEATQEWGIITSPISSVNDSGEPSYPEEVDKELAATKEELRQANWKITILEGVLRDLGYLTEEEE